MRKTITWGVVLGWLLCGLSMAQESQTGCWTVSGQLAVTKAGTVHLKLYAGDEAEAFHLTAKVVVDTAAVRSGRAAFSFQSVPAGTYGIRAWQDVNGNGKLDTDIFGRPKEPWGTYRHSRPRFSGPQWKEMAFDVEGDLVSLLLKLE